MNIAEYIIPAVLDCITDYYERNEIDVLYHKMRSALAHLEWASITDDDDDDDDDQGIFVWITDANNPQVSYLLYDTVSKKFEAIYSKYSHSNKTYEWFSKNGLKQIDTLVEGIYKNDKNDHRHNEAWMLLYGSLCQESLT